MKEISKKELLSINGGSVSLAIGLGIPLAVWAINNAINRYK